MSANEQCSPLEQSGGYDDAMFIDPPNQSSGLLCPVCILVLREPHLMSCCGKHLCKVCLARVKEVNDPCPCCNDSEFQTLFNKGKNGVILGLKVYCSNRGSGCKWTGELGDMDTHIQTKCEYAMADCPCGCGQCVPRHSITKHTEYECSKRPIEVQLKCLSIDMEEKLRAIELKYEEKVTELESNMATLKRNNTVLQTIVKEQERKLDEQEKKQEVYETKIAILETAIATFEEQQKEAEKEEKMAKQERQIIIEVKEHLAALEKQKDYTISKNLQQLREIQKNNEDRLTSLKGSSDLCINELRKMEKHLKEVDSQLSYEVTVPVSLGKFRYLSSQNMLSSTDDVCISGDLNGPNPVIKLQSIMLHQKLVNVAQLEVSKTLQSVVTEMFWFPPEKEEVFKYLFEEEENWKNIKNTNRSMDDVMMFFISSMEPFTVEVCGSNHEGVKKAIDELKSFRDNSPVEVQAEHIHSSLVYDAVERYASSKSVKLQRQRPTSAENVRPRSMSMSIFGNRFNPSANVTLQGGKYDVQLVKDFINERQN